ncbi:MAG: EamA family transporter [Actinomycetota bacterium]
MGGVDIGVLLAGIAALGYGIGDFLGGAATRKMPVGRTLLWAHLVGLVLLVVWIPLDAGEPHPPDLLAGMGSGIFGLGGLAFLFTGLARGRAAVVAPTAAVVGAVVPVAVGAGAGVGLAGWLGVATGLPAIYLLSSGGTMSRRTDGLAFGIAAGVFFGGHFVLLAMASAASGLWPLVASRGLTFVLLTAVGLLLRRGWLSPPGGRLGGIVFGSGSLDLVGNIGFLLATAWAPLVVAAVVTSLYPAVTVVMARLVHREEVSSRQGLGLGLGVAAVALLSVA